MRKKSRDKEKLLPKIKQTFVTDIIRNVAPKIGAALVTEPEYGFVGYVTFKNGKRALFRDRNFNINPQGSSEIARDKGYSKFFLDHFGYKVPEGTTFFSDKLNERVEAKRTVDDGFDYAKKIGFPVILKPNNLSQGALVVKAHNKREFYSTARKILKKVSVVIVEKFYHGNDYRIVVLENEVISAYQRIPLYVIGDGLLSIEKLLKQKNDSFNRLGRETILDPDDFRIKQGLKRRKYNFETVIPKGEKFQLLDNANLSTGGEAVDVTEEINKDFKDLAINITRDMGLKLCGVDIITSAIDLPLKDYVVMEVNSAPGLDNYASFGKKQQQIVEELYLKVLRVLENSL